MHIEILKAPSTEEPVSILCTSLEPSWMDPIILYLNTGTLPTDASIARKIKRLAPHYTLITGQLYKRLISFPLLKCLLPSKAKYALQEVHDRLCGNHLRGRALAYKILRQGYYWPIIQSDAIEYVQACDSCQQHAPT